VYPASRHRRNENHIATKTNGSDQRRIKLGTHGSAFITALTRNVLTGDKNTANP
jgi:hypothetical protein